MHPQQQPRIVGIVSRPAPERSDGLARARRARGRAPLDLLHGGERFGGAAEHHRQCQVERAPQALQRLVLEAAVRGDAGGDQRMGDLQQQRAPAGEQQHGFAIDAPAQALRTEEAVCGIDACPAA